MSKLNMPPHRRSHRVVRHSANTATESCRHRFERMAWWCARRKTRASGPGVYYEALPAVTL